MSREIQTQFIDIYKPPFLQRCFSEFLLQRQSGIARGILLASSIGFALFGPDLVYYMATLLPTEELGSSGASIVSFRIFQTVAALSLLGISYLALKPAPVSLRVDEQGIVINWQFALLTLRGIFIPWNKLGTICIERQAGKTDLRTFKLCLYSKENKKQNIKIPLGNLSNEESRKQLVEALKKGTVEANIEPGALEAIAPKSNLSFTDLWLDALSAAPGRNRLTPMAEGSVLKDRFRILKRLGGGGQATAYLALDTQTEEKIVLKETILPVYADLHTRKQALEKFHAEALALDKVKHKQIVQYLDSFVEDHRAYLVLQYLEGKSLRNLIAEQGPLSTKDALSFSIQMCEILNELHKLEPPLIHRDFTPDNLIVSPKNELVLIDFAVAVSTNDSTDEAAGKIAYMAPEQFKGISTVQSDIYSCAATMFYVMTGKDPLALSQSHPKQHMPELDETLNSIIAKATAQNTESRTSSISELHDSLKKLHTSTI